MGGRGIVKIDGIAFWGERTFENCQRLASLHAVEILNLNYELRSEDNIYHPIQGSDHELRLFELELKFALRTLQLHLQI